MGKPQVIVGEVVPAPDTVRPGVQLRGGFELEGLLQVPDSFLPAPDVDPLQGKFIARVPGVLALEARNRQDQAENDDRSELKRDFMN